MSLMYASPRYVNCKIDQASSGCVFCSSTIESFETTHVLTRLDGAPVNPIDGNTHHLLLFGGFKRLALKQNALNKKKLFSYFELLSFELNKDNIGCRFYFSSENRNLNPIESWF